MHFAKRKLREAQLRLARTKRSILQLVLRLCLNSDPTQKNSRFRLISPVESGHFFALIATKSTLEHKSREISPRAGDIQQVPMSSN
jgi:hypothetical protein